ncbi:penicillin-binding protein 2 [Acinetobacter populi]|uniref:Peptidoglycan D,D-transpeptidase MrdA n=1 Tax=Acinetobacter populi TaxID=1582270 RepID=A0A1Z9YV24_9GAMM|nr:penicillin-binding protein 2 [Acinetobacter populi]OUY06051.1 penicillin-binding protein 2 [Acinetobacter populi]
MSKQPTPIKNIQQEKKIFRGRIYFAIGLVSVFILILVVRYSYLQLYQHEHFQTVSDSNRIRLQALPPARGYIYDRNGILLADNFPVFSAVISRADIEDVDHTIAQLVPIFHLTDEDIEQFQKRAKTARKTEVLSIKMNLSESEIAKFSELKQNFPGVRIETQMTRYYPHGDLFAHVIGYVGRINDKELKTLDKDLYAGTNLIGKIGVEKSYESLLHGRPGYESVEADAHSNILRHLGRKEAVRGNDLYLSLDYGLQMVASEQMIGKRGAVVAIDPNTGEILALVSAPSFNPNLFVTGISHKDYRDLSDSLDQPLYNRAVQGSYPPGSTIKPMEAMGGIHYKYIDWNTKIFDPGYFHLPGDSHKFRDWKKSGHGIVDINKAIVESCDTFFYVLSYQMGIDKMHTWMSQFGFGQKTGVDLPSESSGLYPSPEWKMRTRNKPWLKGETISVSIGQGAFTATPLQLALATAITANYGQHVKPHVLRETKGEKVLKVLHGSDFKIDFDGTQDDWEKMHAAMVAVINSGTGRGIRTPFYSIAGKTGTAQVKSIAQGKRYNEALLKEREYDHGLFVGFAPADEPKIAVAVIWENGRHGGSAAKIAKPIFDYWLLKREKDPIKPVPPPVNGGLMTAGAKPAELPTSGVLQSTPTPPANNTPPSAAEDEE